MIGSNKQTIALFADKNTACYISCSQLLQALNIHIQAQSPVFVMGRGRQVAVKNMNLQGGHKKGCSNVTLVLTGWEGKS